MRKPNLKTIGLFLTMLGCLVLLFPFYNFQNGLSQGDHGRDLYAAYASVFHGQLPYKDYWWIYGPLMPYYYGLFLKIGFSIKSILIGKLLIKFLAGVMFYLAAAELIPPLVAVVGSLWFVHFFQDFVHTYNHVGAIPVILAVIYLFVRYFKTGDAKNLFGMLALCLIASLIKINIGAVCLAFTVFAVFAVDAGRGIKPDASKKAFFACALTALPLIVFLIHWWLSKDLTSDELKQVFPFFGGYVQADVTFKHAFGIYVETLVKSLEAWWIKILWAAALLYGGLGGWMIWKKKTDPQRIKELLWIISLLAVFYVLLLHEFIKTATFYTMSWVEPVGLLFIFIIIGFSFSFCPRLVNIVVMLALCAGIGSSFNQTYGEIAKRRSHLNFLGLPHGQVYITNAYDWIETVRQSSEFLKNNLGPDETFLALPYDPIYYFLTERLSPTRQLIFFDFLHIPREQEIKIIQNLEQKKVNYVVMSNRMNSFEAGLGIFGKTYCPLLALYIRENFKPVTGFGPWQAEAGWSNGHSIMILKRVRAK